MSIAENSLNAHPETIEAGALSITVRIDDDEVYVIGLFGEADLDSADTLEATIAKWQRDRPVVVDLSGLDFIDSSGIAVLFRAVARSRKGGHELRLLRGSARVDRIFVIAGLAGALPFVD